MGTTGQCLLAIGGAVVDVFSADLVQIADQLVEGFAVDDQTADFRVVGDDVGRSHILPIYPIDKKKQKNPHEMKWFILYLNLINQIKTNNSSLNLI